MSFGAESLFAEFNNTAADASSSLPQQPMSDDDEFDEEQLDDNEELLEENAQLKKENAKLRKTLRLLAHQSKIKIKDPTKDGPIAHVIMFNNSVANEKKQVIKNFFTNLAFESSNRRHRQEGSLPSSPQPSAFNLNGKASKHSKKSNKAYVVTQSFQFYKDFYFDQVGAPTVEGPQSADARYERLYLDVLDNNEGIPQGGSGPMRRPRPPKICFNCGNPGHEIRECPEPKNQQNINQRRQHFMDNSTSGGTPQASTRIYEKDREEPSEVDERFKDFKPGAISGNLREALGITKDDLAPYIYQMRWFGYPPGHLEAAKVARSGLSFYHNSSMAPEPGEDIAENSNNAPSIVNVDELVKFPGFNVGVEDNVIDDHVNLGAPPMDQSHSYDVMVSYYKHQNKIIMEKQKSQKTPAKTPRDAVVNNLNNEINEVDMKVDQENDAPNPESPPVDTTSNGLNNGNNGTTMTEDNDNNYDSGEMTEDELEKRRQMILKQLEEEEGDEEVEDEVVFIPPPPLPTIDLTSDSSPAVGEDLKQQAPDDKLSSSFVSNNGVKENGVAVVEGPNVSPIKNENAMDTTANNTVDNSVISNVNESSQIDDLDASDSAVPHRSKFAKGITQFDQFYDETKSKGTYSKLRSLLKQSPHSRVSKET